MQFSESVSVCGITLEVEHRQLLLSPSLNCHFKPHPRLISSSSLLLASFSWQIKFTHAMQPCIFSVPIQPLLLLRRNPRWHIWRPYLITEGHPVNCQEALKKSSKIDSSPTTRSQEGSRRQNIMNKNAQRDEEERWRARWRARHEIWSMCVRLNEFGQKSSDIWNLVQNGIWKWSH